MTEVNSGYEPVDCGFHDRLELHVLRGGEVEMAVSEPGGVTRELTGRITDLVSRSGEEFARVELSSGGDVEVRLDRLVRVDGAPGPAAAGPE